jgi:hypothetical protein
MAGSNYSTTGRQDTTKLDSDKPSSSSRLSDSVREILHKPDTKKNEKLEESKPYKTEKASFLDKTDPNEMGRNTEQIISELENEDKKFMSKKPPSSTSPSSSSSTTDSSSTTAPPKSENKNDKPTTTTDATSDPENKEANEDTKKSDSSFP